MTQDEDDAFAVTRTAASGMGQARRLSYVSSDEELGGKPTTGTGSDPRLISTQQPQQSPNQALDQTKDIDFFTDRDYYKIFLETSKEQTARIR